MRDDLRNNTIIIIDDFIKDPELLNQLKQDSVWADKVTPSKWFERYSTPTNPFEHLINQIYNNTYPDILNPTTVGFEYWGWHVHAGDEGIPIHVDHDEQKCHDTGICVCADWLTIYYPEVSDDLDGGDLHLYNKFKFDETAFFNQDSDEDIDQRDISPLGGPTIISPRSNRLIIAPGCYFHKVTPVKVGSRKSLNCNPWPKPIVFDYDKY